MGRQSRRSVHGRRYHRHRTRLADSLKRYLLITRRRIPLDRSEDYARLWRDVHHAATLNGARAWIFEGMRTSSLFVEFVEWKGTAGDLPAEIAIAVENLNAAFNAEESDIWIEARI